MAKNSASKPDAKPGNDASPADVMEVGAMIRRRRRDMGLTLAQVGQRSGFTTGYLSQLERDLSTPSLAALVSIGRALGVEMDYFLRPPQGRGHHFPASDRPFFSLGRRGMRYARVSGEFPGHVVDAMLVWVPPHYRSPELIKLEGEEMVHVTEGRLRYTMGNRVFDLAPGDVVHLPSNTPHAWENPTDQATHVFWIGTGQIFLRGAASPLADTALEADVPLPGDKQRRKPASRPRARA